MTQAEKDDKFWSDHETGLITNSIIVSKFLTIKGIIVKSQLTSAVCTAQHTAHLMVSLGLCRFKSNTQGKHPVRKNGPIKKLYRNAIGTTEIVGKKKFKIWCHMLGYNDSQASKGIGVGEAFAVLT